MLNRKNINCIVYKIVDQKVSCEISNAYIRSFVNIYPVVFLNIELKS